jgi:hypothetical protein
MTLKELSPFLIAGVSIEKASPRCPRPVLREPQIREIPFLLR